MTDKEKLDRILTRINAVPLDILSDSDREKAACKSLDMPIGDYRIAVICNYRYTLNSIKEIIEE